MAKVYSIFNIKGGVAKSTFNIYCATALFHLLFGKKKVCLIEFDNNKSCGEDRQQELAQGEKIAASLSEIYPKDFKERLKNLYPVYSFKHGEYHENYEQLNESFDIIFLGFPGTLESEDDTPLVYKSIKTIDKAAIPVLPDKKDRRASMKTIALLGKMEIKVGWFINRRTNTKSATMLEDLGQVNFKKINSKILPINRFNTEDLLSVNAMPITIEKNNSTIIPYLDSDNNIKSLVSFFVNN